MLANARLLAYDRKLTMRIRNSNRALLLPPDVLTGPARR